MRTGFAKKRITAVFLMFMVFMSGLSFTSLAANDQEYKIDGYDVNVRINTDGSLNVSENLSFAFYGGFNNIMIPIAKNEGEEIEILHIYIMRKQGLIECKRLLAGQWDAEVFTGTYSVIDEPDMVKLKLYGSFYKSKGSIVLQYKVKNAIKRYGDVAEFNRAHILKSWDTRISNIKIYVFLPTTTQPRNINYWLHGVFVGNKEMSNNYIIIYNVPDTVPGEYVETRVTFPQEIVPDCPVTSDQSYFEQVLSEENDYEKSDKTDLLKARETAARNAEQKAFNERLKQRAKNIFNIISMVLTLAGLYFILFIQRKVHLRRNLPMPAVFHDIERLNPAEVRMLVANGETGARAMLGKILDLASKNYIKLGLSANDHGKTHFIFSIDQNKNLDALTIADRYLLGWISGFTQTDGEFDPIRLMECTQSEKKAQSLKRIHDHWIMRVKEVYDRKNIVDISVLKYRNFGIIGGAVLIFLGLVIPITLSISLGYLMIPMGLTMLLYSLRIRKHTDFGIYQNRIWKTIKQRIIRNNIALDALPSWMRSYEALLGYSLSLGVEKEIVPMLADMALRHEAECECLMCGILRKLKQSSSDMTLYKVIRNTLTLFDEAISSVQDAA